jgi:hypothetical protein
MATISFLSRWAARHRTEQAQPPARPGDLLGMSKAMHAQMEMAISG